MEALKHVLDRYGYWPFIVAALILLTIPQIAIHYATRPRSAAAGDPGAGGTPTPPGPGGGPPAAQVGPGPQQKSRPQVPVEPAPDPVARVIGFDRVVANKVTATSGGATVEQPCEVRLEKVEVLTAGRLRWHLSLENRGAAQVLYQINWGGSYAVDGGGNRASVVNAEFPTTGGWIVLDPRVRTRGWFETDLVSGEVTVNLNAKYTTAIDIRFTAGIPPGK